MYNDSIKYGKLLNKDILLHRQWFKEFVKLYGINVLYSAIKPNGKYTQYTEFNSNFEEPV